MLHQTRMEFDAGKCLIRSEAETRMFEGEEMELQLSLFTATGKEEVLKARHGAVLTTVLITKRALIQLAFQGY